MQVIKSAKQMSVVVERLRRQGKSIGFVPTMGYLHEGHLNLIRLAKKTNDICVASIFVNPAQFGPKEDFKRYPRDFKRDSSLLKKENVDIVFFPSDNDIYPHGYLTYIDVEQLSNVLCGAFRPGHFKGVATVVAKLLNIVRPDVMYLGQKDAQQVAVLKAMVHDLNMPVHIEAVPTIRDADGLAMSSRNARLNAHERSQAPIIYKALQHAQAQIKQGEHSAARIIATITKTINTQSLARIQYVACVDVDTLKPVRTIEGNILIATAVFFGHTRLIDNVIIRAGKR